MSFDWDDYFTLASDLENHCVQNGPDESRYRSSISRAYYAAFHAVKMAAQSKQIGFRRNDSAGNSLGPHEQVHYTFENESRLERKLVGQKLKRLKMFRKKADYQNPYTRGQNASANLESDANVSLVEYLEITELLKKI